ncbi:hypothetical protein [Niabella aquatica]
MEHKAGDKLYVDFAGDKLHITDPATGELKPVEVFSHPGRQSAYLCGSRNEPTKRGFYSGL